MHIIVFQPMELYGWKLIILQAFGFGITFTVLYNVSSTHAITLMNPEFI